MLALQFKITKKCVKTFLILWSNVTTFLRLWILQYVCINLRLSMYKQSMKTNDISMSKQYNGTKRLFKIIIQPFNSTSRKT